MKDSVVKCGIRKRSRRVDKIDRMWEACKIVTSNHGKESDM